MKPGITPTQHTPTRRLVEYVRNRNRHFQRSCLSRRVDCMGTLVWHINALKLERNRARRTISRQFTCQDARSKFAHVYPKIEYVKPNLA